MYVDSHCHLSYPELAAQVPQIREAMAANGVDRALCICTTLEEFEDVHALAMRYDNFWASVGVHPDNEGVTEPTLDKLLELGARPKVVAIGETGQVEGVIEADSVEVRGRVAGAIIARTVKLYATARVDGDITHEQIAIENGAHFAGRSLKRAVAVQEQLSLVAAAE